ncbi:hypothetical protein HNR21_003184 [Actinomadura cellulosilytica]|uniref:Uncharacterized protein n=1 Tax=Thermomonospora cellulosilytica TaxID=1411118 RepID=A0A7W3MYM8_9ACTN|nr:hypothetical protein [Thermomonospora cellulosilytica]
MTVSEATNGTHDGGIGILPMDEIEDGDLVICDADPSEF